MYIAKYNMSLMYKFQSPKKQYIFKFMTWCKVLTNAVTVEFQV